jgi:hypothetical protein
MREVLVVYRKVVQTNPRPIKMLDQALVAGQIRGARETAPVGHYVISGPRLRVCNPFRFGPTVPPVSQKTDYV